MALGWVIAGSIGQVLLSYFLFMLVAFSAGGMDRSVELRRISQAILSLSLYVLPASALLSAVIVICLYSRGASVSAFGWYALPLVAAACYVIHVLILGTRGRGG
jgi:hypothetical protein